MRGPASKTVAANEPSNALRLERAQLTRLQPTSMVFGPGLHVIYCPDGLGVLEFFQLVIGLTPPRRGQVTVRGRTPSTDPTLRAHLGSCLPEERLLARRYVPESLRSLGFAPDRVEAVLTLAQRLEPALSNATLVSPLSPAERAVFTLAIALTTNDPWALVLNEPLKNLSAAARAEAQDRLLGASNDIPVIVVTASMAQAEHLGGASHELIAGVLRAREATVSAWHGLRVVGLELQKLMAALAAERTIRSLRFVANVHGQETLELETSALEHTSLALTATAHETGTRIFSIRSSAVPQ